MTYELLYIIPATYTDEEIGQIESQVKALLEKHGASLSSTSRLGKFRFTYPIKHVRHGHYILVYFQSEPDAIKNLEETLRITPEVLRHLILKAKEAGGEKFDLIQFTEVNLDTKEHSEERPRRKTEEKEDERKAEIKSGVAVLEGQKLEGTEEQKPAAEDISVEELERKIDSALQEHT